MPSAERLCALKTLIDKFLAITPDLWDDPLYRVIIAATGNTFQFSKQQQGTGR